jgi:hypothetical protein
MLLKLSNLLLGNIEINFSWRDWYKFRKVSTTKEKKDTVWLLQLSLRRRDHPSPTLSPQLLSCLFYWTPNHRCQHTIQFSKSSTSIATISYCEGAEERFSFLSVFIVPFCLHSYKRVNQTENLNGYNLSSENIRWTSYILTVKPDKCKHVRCCSHHLQ